MAEICVDWLLQLHQMWSRWSNYIPRSPAVSWLLNNSLLLSVLLLHPSTLLMYLWSADCTLTISDLLAVLLLLNNYLCPIGYTAAVPGIYPIIWLYCTTTPAPLDVQYLWPGGCSCTALYDDYCTSDLLTALQLCPNCLSTSVLTQTLFYLIAVLQLYPDFLWPDGYNTVVPWLSLTCWLYGSCT